MTVVELDSRRKTARQRLVEVALRLENDENVDHWELADVTLEAVEEVLPPRVDSGRGSFANTGLSAVLDKFRDDLREAGATNVASKATLENAYATSSAWPAEDRVEGANYWAHHELRGSRWKNRKRILERLVEDRRKQGGKGLIGTTQVRLRKSDDNKADLRPRDAKLEAGLRGVLRRWAAPQTFGQLHLDEQNAAVRIVEQIAREIKAGEFA